MWTYSPIKSTIRFFNLLNSKKKSLNSLNSIQIAFFHYLMNRKFAEKCWTSYGNCQVTWKFSTKSQQNMLIWRPNYHIIRLCLEICSSRTHTKSQTITNSSKINNGNNQEKNRRIRYMLSRYIITQLSHTDPFIVIAAIKCQQNALYYFRAYRLRLTESGISGITIAIETESIYVTFRRKSHWYELISEILKCTNDL